MTAGATTSRVPGLPILLLAFAALLEGRFTLDRVGISEPLLNDPRTIVFVLLMAGVAAETSNASRHIPRLAPVDRRFVYPIMLFLGYQAASAVWAPEGARLILELTDIAALGLLVIAYAALARWDRERVTRVTLGCFLVAGVVYFLVAASGSGHDASGRWAALGGGPNVFVRIMVLASIAAVYFYCRSGRIVWLFPIPAFAVGVLFSGSRGGLLAFASVIVLCAIPSLTRLRWSGLVRVAMTAIPLAGLTWLLAGGAVSQVVQQRFVKLTIEDGYTSNRDALFSAAIDMFQEHPIGGVGLGGFYAINGSLLGNFYVHNLPLAVAAEGGIIGILLLAAAIVGPCLAVRGRPRTLEARFAAACAIFIGAASLFSGDYYDARLMWVFLALATVTPTHTPVPPSVAEATTESLRNPAMAQESS